MRKRILYLVVSCMFILLLTACSNMKPNEMFFHESGWTETEDKMIRWIRISTTEKIDEVPGVAAVTPLKDGEQLSPDICDFKTITGNNRSQSFLLESEDVGLPSKIREEDDYCFVFIFEKEDYINLDEYKISFNKKVQGIKEITISDSFDH